jgi:ribonuclease HI
MACWLIRLASEDHPAATVEQPATIDFYTDGSVRNGRAGIGIWTSAWKASRTIRRAEETNVHLTELEAIWMAIKGLSHEHNRLVKVRVFTASQSALRSIQSAKINDSLGLVKRIREKITKATFSLHWVPGHEEIKGNGRANELAQKATEVNTPMPNPASNGSTQLVIPTVPLVYTTTHYSLRLFNTPLHETNPMTRNLPQDSWP